MVGRKGESAERVRVVVVMFGSEDVDVVGLEGVLVFVNLVLVSSSAMTVLDDCL